MNTALLQKATAFIWAEGDMLDHGEFDTWLALWTASGRYIMPIDPNETDFANTLNYANDDHDLRQKRVERMRGGKSISTSPLARTVRTVSRIRVLGQNGDRVQVRCAQALVESRRGAEQRHTADITYELIESGDSFKIEQKVIRLVNSTEALTTVGYIL